MPKPRVFVSSVMNGFEDRRSAARSAIDVVGADPVMAEDFTPRGDSPRNACLDGVDSSDVFLMIIGGRGGWMAPSGKIVVEEEYDEAVKRNLPIVVCIEEVARDEAADGLVRRVSDYVHGHFRVTYRDSADLGRVITETLPTILQPVRLPMTDPSVVTELLTDPYEVSYETTARLVVAPERSQEVIDRVTIGNSDFADMILALGHTAPSRIFDYRGSKEHSIIRDALVIDESLREGRHTSKTRAEVKPEGIVVVDKVVSPAGDDSFDVASTFFIVRGDVEHALTAAFMFANGVYDAVDPYRRHSRFIYGVSFSGLGFRTLVEKLESRSSYSMASNVEGVLLLEEPRTINRASLSEPRDEVGRIVTLLGRRLKSP